MNKTPDSNSPRDHKQSEHKPAEPKHPEHRPAEPKPAEHRPPTTSHPEAQRNHDRRRQAMALFFGIVGACFVLLVIALLLDAHLHKAKGQLADTQKQLDQAKAQNTQLQSELDKAKGEATDLQNQLDKEKSSEADLKSQLDLARDSAKELQAQVEKANANAADFQAQTEKIKAQAADLQSQLSQANAGSAQMLTQLDQAKIQTMDLQARLQTAEADITQLQPLLLKNRHIPLTTSVERLQGGVNYRLHVNNLYLQPVTVEITVNGPETTRSQDNVIGAGATLNLDNLSAGQTVIIRSAGYDPLTVPVQ